MERPNPETSPSPIKIEASLPSGEEARPAHDPAIQIQNETLPRFPIWKRAFDIAFLLITCPIWLPAMILLAILIKISSPGPILYCQERVGYRGKHFVCLKFRSMKIGAETRSHEALLERIIQTGCPMTKLDVTGDPRLIRFGPIFRATGLDELPQVFNVLRGEMSIVGPRPSTIYEFERFDSFQRNRVNAPPGLTGYWQVNGKNKTTFPEMIALDFYYVRNMAWWLDFWILLRTAPTLLAQVAGTFATPPTQREQRQA